MFFPETSFLTPIPPPASLGFTKFQRHCKAKILSFSTTQNSLKSPQ
ncbi:Meiotically up-regulated 190 protein [Venturia inaequalis]|nr:Meiotically up-regulated 190 protein [Venturia inaequalis]